MKAKAKANKKRNEMRCPYCGSPVTYRSADGIYKDNSSNTMLYVCARYPVCDAYVRTQPGTRIPVGEMANGDLRALRKQAHFFFDQLYKSGYMSKQEAYRWLSGAIAAPPSKAHIGNLGEYYCRQVISKSRQLLNNRRAIAKKGR